MGDRLGILGAVGRAFFPLFFPSKKGVRKDICIVGKGLAYSTKYSQAVTHPSTNLAQCCLTSVIGRELVCSAWYGRRQSL